MTDGRTIFYCSHLVIYRREKTNNNIKYLHGKLAVGCLYCTVHTSHTNARSVYNSCILLLQ